MHNVIYNYTIKYSKYIVLLISLIISTYVIIFFAGVRKNGYETIPENNIFDERNYALQGISLRESGIPIGYSDSGEYMNMPDTVRGTELKRFSIEVNNIKPNWATFNNFPQPVITVNEFDFGLGTQHLKFVQPFLDHSPLGGLIFSLGINKNVNEFLDIKSEDYRKPALYLAVITSILLFILVLQVFNNPIISTLSVIVYNSVPTYLFATRYALLENVATPFVLIMINLIMLAVKSKNERLSIFFITLAGLSSGFAVLAKESAIGFFISGIILILIYKLKRHKIIYFTVAGLLPIIGYITWGMWLFSPIFIKIFIFNASRGFLGSLNFISTFSNFGFKNLSLDGWWIWGFISFAFLFYHERKKAVSILIPFLCGMFFILFFAGQNYQWYYLALIPFMSIASGYALWKIFVNPDALLLITFFVFALSSSFYWGHTIFHLPASAWEYRALMMFFTLTGTVKLLFPRNKFVNFFWIVIFATLIFIVIKWNNQSILYMISHWKNLEIPVFPKS